MYHMCKCLVIDVDTLIKSVGLGCFQFNYDKIFICFSLTYVIHSASMTTVSSTQQTPFVITRPIITDVNKQKTTVTANWLRNRSRLAVFYPHWQPW
jgi:hypothetical protein